jgi:EAL domain-containing protein (putative c-di-GMP-specific phosphodiesterase class I)/FixJ family two-component response regulator
MNKSKLLVLDDEPVIRELIVDIAEEVGYEVSSAEHPGAIGKVQLGDFDVVVLDLVMPKMDGIEALRSTSLARGNTKLILMSGMDGRTISAARKVAEQKGIQVIGVLAKPFRTEQVRCILKDALVLTEPKPTHEKSPYVTGEELRSAIITNELIVHYQPKVIISENSWCGIEALTRWNHPRHGLIGPDSFVHLAELSEFALPFTFTVLNRAAADLKILTDSIGYTGTVSVNLPATALTDLSLPERAVAIIDGHGIDRSRVIFELTETSLPKSVSTSLDILTRLHMRNIGLSIDDFGTGHSNLERLQETSFSELKIDKMFIQAITTKQTSLAIVDNAIRLGHNLGMKVVAEGPEDAATMEVLKALGCDIAQGYFVSKPVEIDQLKLWAMQHNHISSMIKPHTFYSDKVGSVLQKPLETKNNFETDHVFSKRNVHKAKTKFIAKLNYFGISASSDRQKQTLEAH